MKKMQQRSAETSIQKVSCPLIFFRISLLLVILVLAPLIHGLRCYSCTYSKTTDKDDSCVLNPLATNGIIDCNKKYCTIMRQETIKPREVVSFIRGCDDKPIFLNKVIIDYTFATYFRSCTKDLCNSFDGVAIKDPNVGAANNTIIAGKNEASTLLTITRRRMVGVVLLCFLSRVLTTFRDV